MTIFARCLRQNLSFFAFLASFIFVIIFASGASAQGGLRRFIYEGRTVTLDMVIEDPSSTRHAPKLYEFSLHYNPTWGGRRILNEYSVELNQGDLYPDAQFTGWNPMAVTVVADPILGDFGNSRDVADTNRTIVYRSSSPMISKIKLNFSLEYPKSSPSIVIESSGDVAFNRILQARLKEVPLGSYKACGIILANGQALSR